MAEWGSESPDVAGRVPLRGTQVSGQACGWILQGAVLLQGPSRLTLLPQAYCLLPGVVHSPIHLLTFMHSFTHPFTHPFIHSSIHASIHSFMHASSHSFIHASSHAFIHSSLIHSPSHPCIHSFTHLFTHSFTNPSCIHSPSIHAFVQSLIPPLQRAPGGSVTG